MGKTILESFLGSPQNKRNKDTPDRSELDRSGIKSEPTPKVKTEEINYFTQELSKSGIRVSSLVDINNPLIYGTDAIRITRRSTQTLDTIKNGTNPSGDKGGLIGGAITAATTFSSKILGIPASILPTIVATDVNSGLYDSVQDSIDAKRGTELGKFLKSTGGGNPKTLGIQSVSGGIDLIKNALRRTLFGKPGMPALNNAGSPVYTFKLPYTQVQEEDGYKDVVAIRDESTASVSSLTPNPVNLKGISPIFGIERGSKLSLSPLGDRILTEKEPTKIDPTAEPIELTKYNQDKSYSGVESKRSDIYKESLEYKRKWSSTEDQLNLTKPESNTPDANLRLELVPFWIGLIRRSKKTHFRAMVTGISESVSPSWDSSKFFGNPFSYYTYTGIERSLSFSLKIYSLSVEELQINWQKIDKLTSYSYPTYETVNGSEFVVPPIVDFRLGDIYNKKIAYIESLSYTFPDESTWETDIDGLILPKIIDVSLTLKFIEQPDSVGNLYGAKSKGTINFTNNTVT